MRYKIPDFGAGASSGLLEMTLSKDGGVTARLGTGGTDLSLGTVASSLQGIKTLNKNRQITRAANRNNMANAATALRAQYGFGDAKLLAQLEEILNGRTELRSGSGDGKAQTVTENGKRTVYLNNYKENMTREEQFALGITLGHEAYRDGITGGTQSQFNETAEAVLGHTAMAKRMQSDSMYNNMMTGLINTDINLKNDISAFDNAIATGDWGSFGNYVGNNYDYSADYWRVLSDGNIVFDGSKDLYDENGLLLKHYEGSGGYTDSLAKMLGISVEEASSKLHNDYVWDADKKAWIGKSENSSIKTSDSFKAAYDFQVNYADRVWSDFGGSMETALQAYVLKQLKPFEETWDTPIDSYSLAGCFMFNSSFYEYADEYDRYVEKYYNTNKNDFFNSGESKDYLNIIYAKVEAQAINNDFFGYSAFYSNGKLNPVDNSNVTISTYAKYDDGSTHLFGNPKGFSVDISSSTKTSIIGSKIFTNAESYLFPSSVYDHPNRTSYGSEVRLFGNKSTYIYGHMQNNASVRKDLIKLSQLNSNGNLWRTYLPAGIQIGTLGNTGNSTGPHLHWEYRSGYQWR